MIYCNGCVFVHVPKTGGSTVRNTIVANAKRGSVFFMQMLNHPDPRNFIANPINPHRNLVGRLPNVWKFTFVRNPWDRYASLVCYRLKRVPQVDEFTRCLKEIINKVPSQWDILGKNFDTFDFVGTTELLDIQWKIPSYRMFGAQTPIAERANVGLRRWIKTKNYFKDEFLNQLVLEKEKPIIERFDYTLNVDQRAEPLKGTDQ